MRGSRAQKIARIAGALAGYTEKLVFSFADIESYKKVSRNLRLSGINYREWDEESLVAGHGASSSLEASSSVQYIVGYIFIMRLFRCHI